MNPKDVGENSIRDDVLWLAREGLDCSPALFIDLGVPKDLVIAVFSDLAAGMVTGGNTLNDLVESAGWSREKLLSYLSPITGSSKTEEP